jgi:ribosome-binding factor A
MTKPSHHKKSGASQRMLRVGELVRHALVEVFIHEYPHDPILARHTITFAEVKMTADMRHATIYVMPLGGKDTGPVIDALNKNKRWLRGALAKRIEMRYVPELHFRVDERFDEGDRIGRLLRTPEVARDLKRGKDKPKDTLE